MAHVGQLRAKSEPPAEPVAWVYGRLKAAVGKNSLTAYRRSCLYDDLSALNGCPILREFSSPHRLQLPWKVSREQLGSKEASPGTIELAIPSHVAYTFNVSHGASSCRVNLSGSRLRRLQFFPGSVKLRESTGRAGGLPKGNYCRYFSSTPRFQVFDLLAVAVNILRCPETE